VKVFISWSGDTSRQVAVALRDWLPMAMQAVKPYMSQRDNEAGVRWEEVVSAELNASDFGIICLTPENLKSTWLNFEAGALGKAVDRARVVPLLYKLAYAGVERPLGMFMAKPLDKQGVKETLETMNKHLGAERHLEQSALDGAFKNNWPDLERRLNTIELDDLSGEPQPRDSRDILEELLELVRGISPRDAFPQRALQPNLGTWIEPTPGGASEYVDWDLMRRISAVFGEVAIEFKGKYRGSRIIIRGVPSDADLTPDQERKYDQLAMALEDRGIDLVIRPHISWENASSSWYDDDEPK
jgi:hypothetical protein